jgi:hypothetical protein
LEWPLQGVGDTTVEFHVTPAFYGLEREYGGTDLRVVHSGIPEDALGAFEFDGHNRHWRQGVGELASVLEERPGKPRPGAVAGIVFVGGSKGHGLLVRDVIIGSPASEAGIRPGDLLTAVADRPMGSLDNFHDWVDERRPGDAAAFRLSGRTVQVTLRSPEEVAGLRARLLAEDAAKGH